MSDYELNDFRKYFSVGAEWGDEWYSGNPENIPAKRPPVAKQLETIWDHNNAESTNNYIPNTGAHTETNRARPSKEINSDHYTNIYLKAVMSEKNPYKLAEFFNRVPDNVIQKSARVIQALDKEQGLLGNHYVTIRPFDDCHDAQKFFKVSCKTAPYIKKEAKCQDCSYRKGNHCAMMSKTLVEEVPYTREIANEALKTAYTKGGLTREDFARIGKIKNYKERLQEVYLTQANNKYAAKNDAAGKIHVTPLEDRGIGISDHRVKEADKRDAIPNLLTKLIQNGASWERILSKVASTTGTAYIKSLLPQALKKISEDYVTPINAVKFANCDDFLVNSVSLLKKDAACSSCVFNQGHKCAKLKAAFVKEADNDYKDVLESQFKKAYTSNPDLSEHMAKCINAGVSVKDIENSYLKVSKDKAAFNSQLEKALKTANKISPFRFSNCSGDYYKHVATVYRDHNCTACYHNAGTGCDKLKKAFVNPAPKQFDHETALPMVSSQSSDHIAKKAAYTKKVEDWAQKQLEGRKVSEKSFFAAVSSKALNNPEKIVKTAISKVSSLNTIAWNDCKINDFTKQANTVVRAKKCEGCMDNRGYKCSRFNKDFINPKQAKSFSEQMPIEDDMDFFNRPDGSPRYPTVEF